MAPRVSPVEWHDKTNQLQQISASDNSRYEIKLDSADDIDYIPTVVSLLLGGLGRR